MANTTGTKKTEVPVEEKPVKATGDRKTTPNIRDKADKDTFAKDFLISVDDNTNVPDELIEVNKPAVVLAAQQRGLRTTGDVRLESKEPRGNRDIFLVYTVDVIPATEAS